MDRQQGDPQFGGVGEGRQAGQTEEQAPGHGGLQSQRVGGLLFSTSGAGFPQDQRTCHASAEKSQDKEIGEDMVASVRSVCVCA